MISLIRPLRLAGLAFRQLVRHRLRSGLTVAGVAAALFLFVVVASLQRALDRATRRTADDATLVVYRQNRFCPATSRLPVRYLDEIRAIPGVREVIPVQIVVNNCGASLDIVTFRGVPPDQLTRYAPEIAVVEGSIEAWQRMDDGALVGELLAGRRRLRAGDAFDAAGVRVRVAGILRSPHPQDNQIAYVHLPFLQQASRRGLGEVTQFNVRVADSALLDTVARAIDERFRSEAEPTQTHPEKAFFSEAARELMAWIGLAGWLSLAAAAAVFGLVANAIVLSTRARTLEYAVLETLGYPAGALGYLVAVEGALLGTLGGLFGAGTAAAYLSWRRLLFGNDGQTLALTADPAAVLQGLAVAAALGLLAAAWPAWRSAHRPVVEGLKS